MNNLLRKINTTGIEDATILIVDDQPINLKVLVTLFKHYNLDVRIAENGEQALKILEIFRPDIILLDIMMPGMDGFMVCSRIKSNPQTASIPVIFMTALDSLEDKVSAFAAGGVDYITKPFERLEVMVRLSTHIKLQRQKLELERALAEIKKLSGFLPICSYCKKIRDDKGYWQQVEQYISEHSETQFTHSMCPECKEKYFGEFLRKKEEKT